MKDFLRTFWHYWKRFGQFMGDLFGRLVLTVFYFTIVVPFGLGTRIFGDRLDTKNWQNARWLKRETHDKTLDHARRLW